MVFCGSTLQNLQGYILLISPISAGVTASITLTDLNQITLNAETRPTTHTEDCSKSFQYPFTQLNVLALTLLIMT